MNYDEYRKVYQRVKRAAPKFGLNDEDVEDFTQEVFLSWTKRDFKAGQTIDQTIIDCLRKQWGRKGDISYDTRQKLKNAAGIDDEPSVGRTAGDSLGERRNFREHLKFVGRDDRVIAMLIYEWGLNETEVADIYSVSTSRISQRLKRIQSSISERIKAQESRLEEKGKGTVETILRTKTENIRWGVESFENKGMEIGEPWGMEGHF